MSANFFAGFCLLPPRFCGLSRTRRRLVDAAGKENHSITLGRPIRAWHRLVTGSVCNLGPVACHAQSSSTNMRAKTRVYPRRRLIPPPKMHFYEPPAATPQIPWKPPPLFNSREISFSFMVGRRRIQQQCNACSRLPGNEFSMLPAHTHSPILLFLLRNNVPCGTRARGTTGSLERPPPHIREKRIRARAIRNWMAFLEEGGQREMWDLGGLNPAL